VPFDNARQVTTAWAVLQLFFSGFLIAPEEMRMRWLAPLQYLSAVR
jgi:hypothetical protein